MPIPGQYGLMSQNIFTNCNSTNENGKMTEFEFSLHLSAEEYLQYYEGLAKFIQVRSRCGKVLQFPADKMREFVLKEGVHGTFIMQLDNNNKVLSLRKKEPL